MRMRRKRRKWPIVLLLVAAMGFGINQAMKIEESTEPVKVGQSVDVGDLNYTVTNVEKTKRITKGTLYSDARDTFVIVHLSIKNNGDSAKNVNYTDFKLKKDDKTYSPSVGSTNFLVDGDQTIYNGINPESTMDGVVIFDIAEDTANNADLVLSVEGKQRLYINQ